MTLVRKREFDPRDPPWVHAISRRVRPAYLAGGKHEHRKSWVEERLLLLAGIFAVDVTGYAVMSNHLHIVLRMRQTEAARRGLDWIRNRSPLFTKTAKAD